MLENNESLDWHIYLFKRITQTLITRTENKILRDFYGASETWCSNEYIFSRRSRFSSNKSYLAKDLKHIFIIYVIPHPTCRNENRLRRLALILSLLRLTQLKTGRTFNTVTLIYYLAKHSKYSLRKQCCRHSIVERKHLLWALTGGIDLRICTTKAARRRRATRNRNIVLAPFPTINSRWKNREVIGSKVTPEDVSRQTDSAKPTTKKRGV